MSSWTADEIKLNELLRKIPIDVVNNVGPRLAKSLCNTVLPSAKVTAPLPSKVTAPPPENLTVPVRPMQRKAIDRELDRLLTLQPEVGMSLLYLFSEVCQRNIDNRAN